MKARIESNHQPIRIESDKPIRERNVQISKRSANQSAKNLVNWHLQDHKAKFKAINQLGTSIELKDLSELIEDNQIELKTVQSLYKAGTHPENSERCGRDT